MFREPPYPTVLKPYGEALVELASRREEVVCLSGDLTRQCEVDLFQERLPERFINVGMAEAHMMSLAGAMARKGHIPFVHTFGVFATRRPFDQIVNSIAYPNLPVKIVGFMPGISSPGGPSHQAIEDVAIMRALPNMTVIDVADATEIRQVVPAIADLPGPVYLRLKRGEIPVIFDQTHEFSLTRAQRLAEGSDAAVIANGMMLPAALSAAKTLAQAGIHVTVLNVPVVKPLDVATIRDAVRDVAAVVTAENHTVVGGLGTAVAEVMAEAGVRAKLYRVGIDDTFAEGARTTPWLFKAYGLTAQHIVTGVWRALEKAGSAPAAEVPQSAAGEYAPV